MKLLFIKTSSLGDILCAMPAVSDALRHRPGLSVDWLVEEDYRDLVMLRSDLRQVLTVATRRWRRRPLHFAGAAMRSLNALRRERYDVIVDGQGLTRSAAFALAARGPRVGFSWTTVREAPAALVYGRRFPIARDLIAATRQRQLMAAALGYPVPTDAPDYGLSAVSSADASDDYILFCPDTRWSSKNWPLDYWVELARLARAAGRRVAVPWAGKATPVTEALIERAQVERFVTSAIAQLAARVRSARAIVTGDTGLAHLAAALQRPTVVLYGPTDPASVGTFGVGQTHLKVDFPCAPCRRRSCNYRGPRSVDPACYATLPPARVWQALSTVLEGRGG